MADYAYNTIKIKKSLAKNILGGTEENPTFSFRNVIPIPNFSQDAEGEKYAEWAEKKWGTYDAKNVKIYYDEKEDSYYINFYTSWCPPTKVIEEIIKRGNPGEVYAYSINEVNNYFSVYSLNEKHKFEEKDFPHNINAFSENVYQEMKTFFESKKIKISDFDDTLPEELAKTLYDVFLGFYKVGYKGAVWNLIKESFDKYQSFNEKGIFDKYPVIFLTKDEKYRIYYNIEDCNKILTIYDVTSEPNMEIFNITINGTKVTGDIMFPNARDGKKYEFNKGDNSLVEYFNDRPYWLTQLITSNYGTSNQSRLFSDLKFDESQLFGKTKN